MSALRLPEVETEEERFNREFIESAERIGRQRADEDRLRLVSPVYDPLDEPLDADNDRPARRSTFTASELWDMEFPPVAWIVPDYITAGLTLLVGAPKLGKSWLALDICNAVAQGGYTLGDRLCVKGDVLYAALEDNPRRIKDRLHKVCARKPGSGFTVWTEMRMLDAGGLDDLRRWILAADTPRLIVIDVLNKVRSQQGKSEAPGSRHCSRATSAPCGTRNGRPQQRRTTSRRCCAG